MSKVTTADRANDGNNVYASTYFYTWDGTTFSRVRVLSTPEFANTTKTQSVSLNYSYLNVGDKMRGVIQSCAQMGWPVPDSCTEPATITVSY